MVRCQLFIVSSAKGISWFQINFYCMQFSQREMLHCHSSATDNPLQSKGETVATTWTLPSKITLGEVSWLWTEAGGAQRAFSSCGWAQPCKGEWQCSCTFCSWLEQSWGQAEPSAGVVLCSSQRLLQEGGERVLAAPPACSLLKVLSERKEKKNKKHPQNRRSKKWTTLSLSAVLRSRQRSAQRSILFTAADESHKCWSCALA